MARRGSQIEGGAKGAGKSLKDLRVQLSRNQPR
jgi:hypothetical protein